MLVGVINIEPAMIFAFPNRGLFGPFNPSVHIGVNGSVVLGVIPPSSKKRDYRSVSTRPAFPSSIIIFKGPSMAMLWYQKTRERLGRRIG